MLRGIILLVCLMFASVSTNDVCSGIEPENDCHNVYYKDDNGINYNACGVIKNA